MTFFLTYSTLKLHQKIAALKDNISPLVFLLKHVSIINPHFGCFLGSEWMFMMCFFSYMEINDCFNLIVDFCQTASLCLDLMSMFNTSIPCSILRMIFKILYITAFFYRCFYWSHWYAQDQNTSDFSEIVVTVNEKEFFTLWHLPFHISWLE